MENSKPIVINLFAGPGAGKSTGAAYIFSQLKMLGINCEYISEFAKDKTWEGNLFALSCQEYVFGKQSYRLFRCADKVDVIITDSPIILSIIYNHDEVLGEDFNNVVLKKFNSYNNLNYFIKRDKPYQPIGRNETENEAKNIDNTIKDFLASKDVDFCEIVGNERGYKQICSDIAKKLF